MPKSKLSKKSKRPDKRPARTRYWMSKHLERNKVRNLIKHCNMDKAFATTFWQESRNYRRMRTHIRTGLL